MDNVDTWVWILIAIAILGVLAIAVIWAMAKGGKVRQQQRLEEERRHREHAAQLRDEAREASVTANQTAAGAAAARADADQARLDAERLEQRAEKLETEATEIKQQADERLAKADEIDPDTDAEARAHTTHGAEQTVTEDQHHAAAADPATTRVDETVHADHEGHRVKGHDDTVPPPADRQAEPPRP